MKKLLVSIAALGAFAAPAMAADLYTPMDPMPFSWDGFYIGGHAGYGWGDKDWTLIQNGNGETDCPGCGRKVVGFDVDGFVGGGQLGFNFQSGSFVFGGEVEMSGTGIDGSGSWEASGGNFPGPRGAATDINWLLTVGPHLGIAMDRTLLYMEGGLAVADEDHAHEGANRTFKGGETRTGWFIGAGVEHAFDDHWSARLEYNYIDLGSDKVTLTADNDATAIFDIDQDLHVIKAGINYGF
jgi:outer membrane immunogenic protein